MTSIYLTLTRKGAFESRVVGSGHKLWFQGGGFNVYVAGDLKTSGLTHDQVAHAALLEVQACGGRVSKLRDIRIPQKKRRKTAHSPKQMKLL